jgi:hypothetical protein
MGLPEQRPVSGFLGMARHLRELEMTSALLCEHECAVDPVSMGTVSGKEILKQQLL